MRAVLIAALVSVICGFATADTDLRDGTLAGLGGVDVVMARMSASAESTGVTQVWGEAFVEGELRDAGVPVLDLSERLRAPGYPYLFLNVTVARVGEHPLFAYNVRLDLYQSVLLDRDRKIHAPAPTWSATSKLGYAGKLHVESSIKAAVEAATREFIEAYSAANPR